MNERSMGSQMKTFGSVILVNLIRRFRPNLTVLILSKWISKLEFKLKHLQLQSVSMWYDSVR